MRVHSLSPRKTLRNLPLSRGSFWLTKTRRSFRIWFKLFSGSKGGFEPLKRWKRHSHNPFSGWKTFRFIGTLRVCEPCRGWWHTLLSKVTRWSEMQSLKQRARWRRTSWTECFQRTGCHKCQTSLSQHQRLSLSTHQAILSSKNHRAANQKWLETQEEGQERPIARIKEWLFFLFSTQPTST